MFKYEPVSGGVCLTGYLLHENKVCVPSEIEGLPVIRLEGTFAGCREPETVLLPDSLTEIGISAFENCPGILKIDIPDSVRRIGERAFMGCTYLNTARLPDGVSTIERQTFSKCERLSIVCTYEDAISSSYYFIKKEIMPGTLILNSTLTEIGPMAFSACTELYGITLPDSVTLIDSEAFSGCRNLREAELPDSVTHIGERAFYECVMLPEITVPRSVSFIGDGAFARCCELQEIDVRAGSRHFRSVDGVLYTADMTELVAFPAGRHGDYTVPDSVTRIRACAFSGCLYVTRMSLPAGLREIGEHAFACCPMIRVSCPEDSFARRYCEEHGIPLDYTEQP